MKFNIYGRSQLEIRRENDSWEVVRRDSAARALDDGLFMSSALETEDDATYLDELCLELECAGQGSKLLS
jgi:hypothetical protein